MEDNYKKLITLPDPVFHDEVDEKLMVEYKEFISQMTHDQPEVPIICPIEEKKFEDKATNTRVQDYMDYKIIKGTNINDNYNE